MKISHTSRLLTRYFSNPKFISHPSASSLPETLNPSFQSHQFHTEPTSGSPSSSISSSGSPPISCRASPFRHNYSFKGFLRPHCLYRLLSNSPAKVNGNENKITSKQISEIVKIIRAGDDDIESKLNLMGIRLTVESVTGIFRVLNLEKLSALRFCNWVRRKNENLYYNSTFCSLVIENCGWVDDYDTMTVLLRDLRSRKVCLLETTFRFLPVLGSSEDSIKESIRKIIKVLNEIGGSCGGSGIVELIKMLCTMGSFEIAKFVLEITERKASYYHILVRDRCGKSQFDGARQLFDEMRDFGCGPDVKVYNYLLGGLCKNNRTDEACAVLEEMLSNNCLPDALTFEIFIYFYCKRGELETATKFLDRMLSSGLKPRLATHAAFVKGFFDSNKFEESYEYVVNSGITCEHSRNMTYSLLAGLHQKKGDLVAASNILIEMMDKDLKPNFSAYMTILRQLRKAGRGNLARDLENRFSRFRLQAET